MTWSLRLVIELCLMPTFLVASDLVYGQAGDDALRSYAVTVSGGKGIYLGNGLVLSAAHVAGTVAGRKRTVRFGEGLELPATFIKADTLEDLTVLSVDVHEIPADIRNLHVALCKDPPMPGDAVVVVTPEGTTRSHIMSPDQFPPDSRERFSTIISDVETSGKSGSGIFDARNGCLLGIMSALITVLPYGVPSWVKPLATYFVPAWTIESFIPSKYRF